MYGILVQTFDSNNTVTHYEKHPLKGLMVLYLGDLTYANNYPFHDNVRWDTSRRFTKRSAVYQPWIWTGGSHEIDFAPEISPVYSSYKTHYMEGETMRVTFESSFVWYKVDAVFV
ncbi:hypothetical protein Ancab_039370 [Ancistrocladus abbreviatus]